MLKSLQLAGFKSFADKTRLEFPAGVTVVVGPNGSGKSNVVDAVKWVLGSQSPRSLRGKEMTDVIFGGAEDRAAMNSAEVTLAFDNTPSSKGGRRLFDLDETEIRLTRRVHRGGEGEYLVNGRTCRLKDFRELLAGTGVGADSYSIIEQGRVDAALRASPLERRLLLEEAAGISRFRIKKREAAKRLERVEQNLLRLSDLVDEVEGRLRRVRAQAGKARRYREASLRLKEARTDLAAADWRKLATERRELASEKEDLTKRIDARQQAIAEDEERLARIEGASRSDESAEEALRQAEQRLTRADRVAAIARVEAARAGERVEEVATRAHSAKVELANAAPDGEAVNALRSAEATAEDYRQRLSGSRDDVQRRRGVLQASRTAQAQIAERRRRVAEVLAKLEARTEAARLRQRQAEEAASRHAAETTEAEQRLAAARRELDEAGSQRDEAADALMRIDQQISQQQRQLADKRRELTDAQQAVGECGANLVGLRHRLEAIEREERRLDRLAADLHTLAASAPGGLQVHGLVADLLHVEADFVGLVEAALGPRAEHVVVDRRDALLAVLSGDQELSTRAGFEPLDAILPAAAVDQIDLSNEPGVIGRATDFAEVEPRFAPLVRRLFARTWFVDSLETASRLNRSVGGTATFVTLAGEVVAADGSVRGGPSDGELRILRRRQDAETLASQIGRGEADLEGRRGLVSQLEAAIAEAEAAVEASQAEAVGLRERLAAAAQAAATLDERRRHAEASVTKGKQSNERAAGTLARCQTRLSTLIGRGRSVASVSADLEPIAGEAEQRLGQQEREVAAAEALVAELEAAATRHEELLTSLRREAKPEANHAGLAEAAANAVREMNAANREAEQATARSLIADNAVNAAAIAVAERSAAALQSRAARQSAEKVRVEIAGALAQARVEADQLVQRRGEIDLRMQRAELDARTVAQRVRDDYGVDVTTLPETEEGSSDAPSDLRAEIESLRREVQDVGAVNMASLEELDELETRFAELTSQYEDLSQAKRSLARLTGRINADSRELFNSTFEAVREHFRELFTRLFGGGEADLMLVDPPGDESGDPLEGGVEIVASPPGKELRSLSLMSGGEKTMTCVALLLALFRSRPSPFCLLDEVDAALDEANVGRFLEVLKDFLGSTQFLVISHSKRTMAGADTLYGITMQESGVSKPISVRFEDVDEQGHIRVRKGPAVASQRRAA